MESGLKTLTVRIDRYHVAKAQGGSASQNFIALAINDRIRSDYRATVNGANIMIWPRKFDGHSLFVIPTPEVFRPIINQGWTMPDMGMPIQSFPYQFEIDIPEQYHRRPGRNIIEDFEFAYRHAE